MAEKSDEANEIRETAAAYDPSARRSDAPPPPVAGEPRDDSPFWYGFRWLEESDAEGRKTFRRIPLTADDYLHPQEGDQMTQGNPHQRIVRALADVLQRWLERFPGVGVFSDVLIRWGISGLPNQAPDVWVVRGLEDPTAIRGRLDCSELGVLPELAIEVISTTHKEYREKDERDKVRIYERAGVAEYLIVDPAGYGKGEPYLLTGYRLDVAGRYQRIAPDARGALHAETASLYFVSDAERGVFVEVAETGERLLYSDEAEEALLAAEAARLDAEQRATEAEARLARLLAGSGKPST